MVSHSILTFPTLKPEDYVHVPPIQMDAPPVLAELKWPGDQHLLMLMLYMTRQIDKINVLKLIALEAIPLHYLTCYSKKKNKSLQHGVLFIPCRTVKLSNHFCLVFMLQLLMVLIHCLPPPAKSASLEIPSTGNCWYQSVFREGSSAGQEATSWAVIRQGQ